MGLEKAGAATLVWCDFSKAKAATVIVKYDVFKGKKRLLQCRAAACFS